MSTIKTLNIHLQEYDEPIKCKYDSSHMTAEACLNQYLLACLNGSEEAELTFYNSKEVSTRDKMDMIEVVGENIFTDSVVDWLVE